MTFTLGQNQINLLQNALNDALAMDVPGSTGAYARAYEILFAMITVDSATGQTLINEGNAASIDHTSYDLTYLEKFSYEVSDAASGVDAGAWIFLRGVSEVNWRKDANPDPDANTTYSELVREYTKSQYETRFGVPATEEQVQDASDLIARFILEDVINNGGLIPTIDQIATEDAEAAVNGENGNDGLFNEGQVGGWAGNPFLLPVGHDASYRQNILHENDPTNTDTYDVLTVIDSTLEAAATVGFTKSFTLLIWDVLPSVIGSVPGALQKIGNAIYDTEVYLDKAYGDGLLPFDNLLGTALSPIVLGTKNDDLPLSGTDASDIIHGGAGNDYILGSKGSDIVGAQTDHSQHRRSERICRS